MNKDLPSLSVMLDWICCLYFLIKFWTLYGIIGFFVSVSKIKLLNSVEGQTNLLDTDTNDVKCRVFMLEGRLDVPLKIPRDILE